MHRTRFGRLLSLACVPSSRRTSSTPAELRLLPTQRPVRDGQYGYERGLRKSPETRNYARSGKRRSAPRRELPKPPDRPPRAENERNDRTPAVSSTLHAYRCLERLLYPCRASTYFGWRSVQGGSYGTSPTLRKRPQSQKVARSGKSADGVCPTDLRAILGTAWSGVRAAEGARLEIAWAGLTRLEGSNPSHSVRRGAGPAAMQRPSASIPGRFPGV
jgi:hypothetical protein